MAFKIIWSEFAEIQLDEIYKFYENKAGSNIAKKHLKGIINETYKKKGDQVKMERVMGE
ncbi:MULTISPECIES: hypothetical protein [Winogradskyella]|uniref:Type II toxin-antitoxin system RelE/ParE family toxin n=1 Tax=Winogradskyella damuponensis TaxID=943939 RepID=A0ABP8CTK8_9FLAO